VAALLTGFVLIPNVGVVRLTLLTGGLLVATALLGLALHLRSGAQRAAAMVALPLAAIAAWHLPTGGGGGGGDVAGLIALAQSPYAEIRVLDTPDGRRRLLVIDGGTHTIVDPGTWESRFPYVAVMGLARCISAEPGRMLLIGLGGGSLVKDFAADGWEVDAVEIDPVVVEMAKAHFGLTDAEGSIQVADGRQFLIAHTGRYDVIAMDAFGSSSIPFHLVTQEVFGLVASRLSPQGLLAINLESHGWDGPVVKAIAASLKPHFREVLALPAQPARDQLGNVVLLASNTPLALRPDTAGRRRGGFDCEDFYWNASANLGWNQRFAPDTAGVPPLTDDLNPVDVWSEHTNFVARRDLHRYFGEQGLRSY
jgi:spermidine synthase